MPDGAQPKLLLDSIRELYPEKFSPARIEVLTAEVTEVVTDLDLWGADLATRLAYTSLSLILATQDTAIPRDRSARFLARLEPESFSLHELEDDHSFTQNRTQLAAAVVSAVFATLPPGG